MPGIPGERYRLGKSAGSTAPMPTLAPSELFIKALTSCCRPSIVDAKFSFGLKCILGCRYVSKVRKMPSFLPKQVAINCPKSMPQKICPVSHEVKSQQSPSRSFAGMQEPMQKLEQCDNGVLSFKRCPNSKENF